MSDGVTTFGDPKTIADAFPSSFKLCYDVSPSISTDSCGGPCLCHVDNLIVFECEVFAAITKLKRKRTAGPNGIPSFIVKDCVRFLVKQLAILFNLSLSLCMFPSAWKSARIISMFKSGDKSHITN